MSEDAAEPSIAVVTALPKEHAAVSRLVLDSEVVSLENDTNLYRVGAIPGARGLHRVVVACLPKYGNNIAGITTTNIIRTFPSIQDVLMVGICAGIPRPEMPAAHVRLGDVVVSSGAGVAQFDFGASKSDGFEYRGTPPPPSARLLQAVNLLESELLLRPDLWADSLGEFLAQSGVARPKREPKRSFVHPRDPNRRRGIPRIFRGIIGASNALVKNAAVRDEVVRNHNIIALEMEGSGVADATWDAGAGYLLVRGVCDYADKNKDDSWQQYAAHVAAAYAQALLLTMPGSGRQESTRPTAPRRSPSPSPSEPIVPDERLRSTFTNLDGQSEPAPRAATLLKGQAKEPHPLSVHLSANRLTVVEWIDDDIVACGGFDGTVHWLDASTGVLFSTESNVQKFRAMTLVGDVLLCGDDEGQVTMVGNRGETSRVLCRCAAPVYALAFEANNGQLFTGDRDGNIISWKLLQNPFRLQRLSVLEKVDGPIFAVIERSSYLIACGSGGKLIERDLRTGRLSRINLGPSTLFCAGASTGLRTTVAGAANGVLHMPGLGVDAVQLHEDAIRALVMDEPWVVTSSKDGAVKAHNLATGSTTVLWTWRDYGYGLALSPSKKRLALVSGGGELAVLEFPRHLASMSAGDMEAMANGEV